MEEEEVVLDNGKGEKKPKGKETKEPERDVYTFPGDSDQESPPPAPWAHCTFIQRCRKKRVLLRPFSGLGTLKRTLPETAKLARPSPQKSETVQLNRGGGVYDFEEVSFGEGGVEPIKFRDRGGIRDKEGEESGVETDKEIFTCVECSIYFKKQVHLQEHMIEHNQSGAGGVRRLGKGSRFRCIECGWNLPNRLALADHHRRHEESRLKILEEIEKLNENGKAKEFQTLDSKVLKNRSIDPTIIENTSQGSILSKVVDPDTVKSPPLSLASTSLTCGHCGFLTSSESILREHRALVHPGEIDESGQHLKPSMGARIVKPNLDPEFVYESGSQHDATQGKSQRFSTRGKTWTDLAKLDTTVDGEKLPESEEEEQDQDQKSEFKTELCREEENGKVFFLRRSTRVAAAPVEIDSDDDEDIDEERVRRFLSEGVLDEDKDEIDEDTEALKSVERKCPYCPDRFHNGIGLANHVRGHLNRVGVSYNVRHFISPEEVNAIEKKFSYQKKKKKVANFDPDTFSVMHCEFCSAGFDTRAGLSSHARAHLRDFGITNWDVTISPIHILRELDELTSAEPPTRQKALSVSTSLLIYRFVAENGTFVPGMSDCGEPRLPRLFHTVVQLLLFLFCSLSYAVFHTCADNKLKCEVCEAQFETRRGLSIHARSHLRQLGITVSDGSGTSIELLRRIAKERKISSSLQEPLVAESPSPSVAPKDEDMDLDEKPIPLSLLAKAAKAVPPSSSSTPSPGAGGIKNLTSNLSGSAPIATAKPLWAPEENDAPLNLTLEVDPNKDIVCQLCGAWFETRKGLSSHARAHLRHFGVEYSESKGSPISLLNQLIDTDDFKHKASALQLDNHTEPRSLATTTLSSSKPSLLTLSSSSSSSLLYKEIGCEFCGEYFENRKGLSSHARSHLRQMGITEWSVNGSPIDTLREIITRRGLPCALPLKPLKTPPPSSPGPPRSPLSVSSSPSATLLSRLPFAFARPSSPQPAVSKSSSAPPTPSSGLILKLKPEPVQVEVTTPGAVGRSGGFSAESLNSSWRSSDSAFPLNLGNSNPVEPTRDIRCEFCGEYFENRKGLSSHARSHLRQMGITEWSVNGSPIDTLREVMHKRGVGGSSQSDQGVKKELSQGANSPSWESTGGASGSEGLGASGYQSSKFRKSPLSLLQSGSRLHKQGVGSVGPSATPSAGKFFRMSPLGKRPLSEEAQKGLLFTPSLYFSDPSCELCGFFFENRKALASHARAHLRQFGVTEWCVNGSPIETLSAWMRSRPQKVLEMHRSYMQGNRTALKKVRSGSQSLVTHFSRITQISAASRAAWSYFRPLYFAPTSFVTSSSCSGFERRPLKHPSCPDGTERDSGPPKPPRTGTVPALVPKPPSYPLVKVVGKFYTLKCRFCEVEFHGPLSVQEDWIRHLQQHILKMNYNKSILPPKEPSEPQAPFEAAF
uniref:C2H2-type domain-containing protein n=1 Tax=Oreochromis aureus TaxID=47969 RepID=A0AAZ1XPV4_OREAU